MTCHQMSVSMQTRDKRGAEPQLALRLYVQGEPSMRPLQILCRLQIDVKIEQPHCWTELGLLQRRGEEYQGLVEWYRMRMVARSEYSRWAQHYYNNTTLHCRFREMETLRRYLDVLVNLM